jgi:ribosome-binding protein aMBF1 (putative translation factor)
VVTGALFCESKDSSAQITLVLVMGPMNNLANLETFHSFGDWLRRRRKVFDLTQAQLAQRVGCTAAMIRKIEADERMPSRQLAELLATALGVPDGTRAAFLQAARQGQAAIRLPSPMQTPGNVSSFSTPSHNPPITCRSR